MLASNHPVQRILGEQTYDMGIFARSLGLARVTPVVGGYAFMYPHSLSGSFCRSLRSLRVLGLLVETHHKKGVHQKSNGSQRLNARATVATAEI